MRVRTARPQILVVDDEPSVREALGGLLKEAGYTVSLAADEAEALALSYDAAFLDLRLPGVKGLSLLKELKKREPAKPVIMISGQGSIREALEAVKLGAFDFLEKPLGRDRVLLTLRNALEAATSRRTVEARRAELPQGLLVGSSRTLARLRAELARAAATDLRVLILGESGTGKELAARSLHESSRRRAGPFVRVNCAAIPETLIESELFGHARGAFTGAHEARAGRFELAQGGTLFLDEVGDLHLSAQAKLLRALQEGEVERLGEGRPRKVDVRVLAATHQDLPRMAKKGTFREDLYYRLNVLPLRCPSLREHPEDIPELVASFIAEYSQGEGQAPRRFSPEALAVLGKYSWPGNVRELKNVVERALVLAPGLEVSALDLPADLRSRRGARRASSSSLGGQKAGLEKDLIQQALAETGGNVLRAAKKLGIERSNLHKKMARLGIQRREFHG